MVYLDTASVHYRRYLTVPGVPVGREVGKRWGKGPPSASLRNRLHPIRAEDTASVTRGLDWLLTAFIDLLVTLATHCFARDIMK